MHLRRAILVVCKPLHFAEQPYNLLTCIIDRSIEPMTTHLDDNELGTRAGSAKRSSLSKLSTSRQRHLHHYAPTNPCTDSPTTSLVIQILHEMRRQLVEVGSGPSFQVARHVNVVEVGPVLTSIEHRRHTEISAERRYWVRRH